MTIVPVGVFCALKCVCVYIVWETGRVITFENVPSHMETAKHNFKKWCQNWRCLHGRDWPNNVDFVQGDVGTAGECSAASDIDCVRGGAIQTRIFICSHRLTRAIYKRCFSLSWYLSVSSQLA